MDIQNMLLSVLFSSVMMVLTLYFNRSLDYVWQPLRIDYKMKRLREAMKDLKARYTDIKNQVLTAELEQKTCIAEVERWLQKVESIQYEVIDIEAEIFKWRLDDGGFPSYLKFWKRYCIGHKVVDKLKEVTKLFNQGAFKDVATKLPPPPAQELPSISRSCSMDCNRDQILVHLEKSGVRCIGIWGMGGVGKTTLLKEINNYFAYNQRLLFDHVIFVVASRNVTPEQLQKKILETLKLSSKGDDSIRATRLLNFVKDKKVLLLLDDLWEHVDLVGLGFPLKQGQCKMVFTTRSDIVCCSMKTHWKLKVQLLNSKEAWSLFEENVRKNIIEADPNIRSCAEKVVKECRGLPLALITIGRVMSGKKTWEEWQDALYLLSSSRLCKVSGISDTMFPMLKFSYENLPDDRTRACFLSYSMWPEDFEIRREDLIVCWMGLGLLDDYNEISRAFDKGHSIIESLINVCLFEHVEKWEAYFVKMHDVLRDMALWIALDHGSSKNKWIIKGGLRLTNCQLQDWAGPERISLMDNQINTFLGPPPVGSKLSILLLNKNPNLYSIPPGIFDCLGSLTYLDLSSSSIANLPKDICKLVNLEFLNISNTGISYLPDGFNNLVKLKYLLLENTYIKSISWKVISSLPNLVMLDLYNCPALKKKKFQCCIQALDGRQITLKIDVFTISALKCLFNLSTICILKLQIKKLKNVKFFKLLSIAGLSKLEINNCSNLKKLVVNGLEFGNLPRLETLSIEYCSLLERIVWRGVTPRVFLPSLRSLNIFRCRMLKNISWVSQLPNLVVLDVHECNGLEMVTGDAEDICGFSRLKKLCLMELLNLGSICSSTIPFPSLECLYVYECPKLKKLPFKESNIPNKLQKIGCETERWDSLEWEDDNTKPLLERYFKK